jgi:agmatinase
MRLAGVLSLAFWAFARGHQTKQEPLNNHSEDTISRWKSGYSFTGIQTFAHLRHVQCLVEQEEPFDIAVIGVPFDTSVAYRPGNIMSGRSSSSHF